MKGVKAHQRYDHGWLLQTAHGRSSLLRTPDRIFMRAVRARDVLGRHRGRLRARPWRRAAGTGGDVHVTGCVGLVRRYFTGLFPPHNGHARRLLGGDQRGLRHGGRLSWANGLTVLVSFIPVSFGTYDERENPKTSGTP